MDDDVLILVVAMSISAAIALAAIWTLPRNRR